MTDIDTPGLHFNFSDELQKFFLGQIYYFNLSLCINVVFVLKLVFECQHLQVLEIPFLTCFFLCDGHLKQIVDSIYIEYVSQVSPALSSSVNNVLCHLLAILQTKYTRYVSSFSQNHHLWLTEQGNDERNTSKCKAISARHVHVPLASCDM